jgi:ectoine hydroxylase
VVIFDRRLYHGRSDNYSEIDPPLPVRRLDLPLDRPARGPGLTPEHPWWDELSPIQQQLLGAGKDSLSYWGLGGDSYPLREYLRERGLLDPKVNNNR